MQSSPRERWDLAHLSPAEVVLCGAALARAVKGFATLEEAAAIVTEEIRQLLWDTRAARPATVLARFYRTIAMGQLEPELQSVVAASAPGAGEGTKCLTLMGSAGDLPNWNSRRQSAGHRAIPLSSPEGVQRLPMVARLIKDMGMSIEAVVEGALPAAGQSLEDGRVFYVPDALGNPIVPDQAFVVDHGVKSVVGFGGPLESGDLWAVILFARVEVSPEVARLFRILGADVRVALRPVLSRRLFANVGL